MAALNFLKPSADTAESSKVEPTSSTASTSGVRSNSAYELLLKRPIISEKSARLQESSAYVFEVDKSANKIQIKRAVEGLYGVRVQAVRMVTIHPKRIQVRRRAGWKQGYKKAIVSLAPGQTIEII